MEKGELGLENWREWPEIFDGLWNVAKKTEWAETE